MSVLIKDPDASLDYGVSWSDYLQPGEAVSQSDWFATPDGDLVLSSETNDGNAPTVRVEGGVSGRVYSLTNRITTITGRTDDRTITIRCGDR